MRISASIFNLIKYKICSYRKKRVLYNNAYLVKHLKDLFGQIITTCNYKKDGYCGVDPTVSKTYRYQRFSSLLMKHNELWSLLAVACFKGLRDTLRSREGVFCTLWIDNLSSVTARSFICRMKFFGPRNWRVHNSTRTNLSNHHHDGPNKTVKKEAKHVNYTI